MGTLHVGSYTIETSSEDKVLFPESGITKGDLIAYYRRIGDVLLVHLRRRPLTLHRFPDGLGGDGFFQQRAPAYFPDWIDRVTVETAAGSIPHAAANKIATLVYLANQAAITLHAWLSRADALRQPDQLVFDLDPSGSDFARVREAAQVVRTALDDAGLVPFVMTTGSSGLHVRAPLRRGLDFDAVRAVARQWADRLADRHPTLLTTEQRKAKRRGRVFLDTLRNAYGQTAVAPYSVRAREGAPVATPLTWNELDAAVLTPQRYTIKNIFRRLGRKGDPWADMHRHARSL